MNKLGKRLKRWLYLTHRWLGILTCLLFAVWFVSGVVMMYVGFPRLTDAERRAALPAIAWDRVALTPGEALARAGLREREARRIALSMLADTPVYRIVAWEGARRTVSAVDGRAVGDVAAETALDVAAHHPAAREPHLIDLIERDQWSVPQRFDLLRPFHRIALGDAAGTELYVSRATGEVALDTSRHERFWNWFGAVPHWIYFTPLRAQADLWRDVVLWVSGIAVFGALTGLVVGILRVRLRRRYPSGAVTPYRGWFAWHHLGGLVAGTTLLTFILSGWLSMNPNRWFAPREPDRAWLERYAGRVDVPFVIDRAVLSASCADAKEAQFSRLGGRPFVLLACGAEPPVPCCGPDAGPTFVEIVSAARQLLPDPPQVRIKTLFAEDAYWYGHHRERDVPILRAVFADRAATWFHIDPATGEVIERLDRSVRLQRWLFNGLHSFDFGFLTRNRPAWDALLLLLSAGGLLIALSGVVIGWRRLARRTPRGASTALRRARARNI